MSERNMTTGRWVIFCILLIIAFTTMYPLFFMAISSFKTRGEYLTNLFGLPHQWFFKNYLMIFDRFNILRLAANSFIVTALSIVISLLVTTMAAFSIAKLPFRGSSTIFSIILACMMVPGQVLMIPVYLMMSKMGLIDTYFSLIFFYVATSIPFATYLLTANCKSIPDEMLEAAKIDGASMSKVYYMIMIPMMLPTILTLSILNFLGFWNELLYAMLFLQTESMQTMTVAVATIVGRYTTNMPLMMTGLLINCLPVIMIFLFFQQYVAKGIIVGAIK